MYKVTIETPFALSENQYLVIYVFPREKLVFMDSSTFVLYFNTVPMENRWIKDILCNSVSFETFIAKMKLLELV